MVHDFFISQWSVWPPIQTKDNSVSPSQAELLSSVPKMLRRRLTPLAKIVFCAANQCIDNQQPMPVVFSSSHGELAKSFAMMQLIEAGEEVSPTAFSLSVHNAIAGLFSIAYANKLESTVIASAEEGIAAAFIEAIGLLIEGNEQVLIVFYDEPLVEFYPSSPYQLSAKESCAVALKISKKDSGLAMRFSQSKQQGARDDGEQPVQIPLLIDFLSSNQQQLKINSSRQCWCWQKR